MIVRETEGTFVAAPEGNHRAICIGVIDLGTHYSEWYKKRQHKVLIQWELPEERVQWQDENGHDKEMPAVVNQRYNATLGSESRPSKLREHLVMWRARSFTPEEIEGFDTKKLLGVNCYLTIVHSKPQGDSGPVYANVAAISKLPKDVERAEPEHEMRYYAFDKDMQIPDSITGKLRDTIMTADEWNAPQEDETSVTSVLTEDEFPSSSMDDTGVPF